LISTWHLYGFNDEIHLQKVKDSKIQLNGIIFNNQDSKAIMLVNAKEFVFKIGDKIDDSYTIQNIEKTRVIFTTPQGIEEMALFVPENDNVVKNDKRNPVQTDSNDNGNENEIPVTPNNIGQSIRNRVNLMR
jgi:type II secretory pathway component PulC